MITAVPYVKIEAQRIVVWHHLDGYVRKKNNTSFVSENNKKGKVKGKLSPSAKKKIKNIIISWLSTLQFFYLRYGKSLNDVRKHIKFITLTISEKQKHSDEHIKNKMLVRMIEVLKRKYNLTNYLWIAETQKNGNIHFHIITNTNIYHKDLRNEWNKIQERNGYLDKYYLKHNHKDANSTDIHTLIKVRNLTAYLTKEATKGQQVRPIEGKIWGCSKELLNIKSYNSLATHKLSDTIEKLKSYDQVQEFKDDFFAVYFYESVRIFEELFISEREDIRDFYEQQMVEFFQSDIDNFFN